MSTKRRPLARRPRPTITAEMVELYRRGRKILVEGADEKWENEGGRRGEFLEIGKRLNWTLLKRDPHQVSVFDDLDGEPPAYMRAHNSPAFPDFNGWYKGQELQRRLQAAADKQAGDGIGDLVCVQFMLDRGA